MHAMIHSNRNNICFDLPSLVSVYVENIQPRVLTKEIGDDAAGTYVRVYYCELN